MRSKLDFDGRLTQQAKHKNENKSALLTMISAFPRHVKYTLSLVERAAKCIIQLSVAMFVVRQAC